MCIFHLGYVKEGEQRLIRVCYGYSAQWFSMSDSLKRKKEKFGVEAARRKHMLAFTLNQERKNIYDKNNGDNVESTNAMDRD